MELLLLGYVIGFFIAVPAMGPASALIIRRALFGREREAFAFGVGSTCGEGFHTFAAVWGVELLFHLIPGLKGILEWVGVAVLFGIGAYFAIGEIPDDPEESDVDQEMPEATTLGKQFIFGFVITVVNPTLIAMWSTAIGLLMSVAHLEFAYWEKWFFPVTVMAGEITWFVLLVILAKRFGASADQRLIHWIIRGLGALLVGLGAWSLYAQLA